MKKITFIFPLFLVAMLFSFSSCDNSVKEELSEEPINTDVMMFRPDQGGGNTSGGDCDHVQHQDVGHYYGMLSEDDIIPNDQGHDFRDNFLSNYEIGNAYTDYYYAVSEATDLYEIISVEEFWDYFNLLQGLHNCAEILQYGNDTDIPITSELLDQAIFVINDIRDEPSSTPEIVEIMNVVEADFVNYQGMTREEVLNSIN